MVVFLGKVLNPMTSITYSFVCPKCGVKQKAKCTSGIKTGYVSESGKSARVCSTCYKEDITIASLLSFPLVEVVCTTTLWCDCVGCTTSIDYTNQPRTGEAANLLWVRGKVDDPTYRPGPGLPRHMLDRDVCPRCFQKLFETVQS
jgi:hypothetical protein